MWVKRGVWLLLWLLLLTGGWLLVDSWRGDTKVVVIAIHIVELGKEGIDTVSENCPRFEIEEGGKWRGELLLLLAMMRKGVSWW